jgi:tetratricopeptide (TPR) repeat protein
MLPKSPQSFGGGMSPRQSGAGVASDAGGDGPLTVRSNVSGLSGMSKSKGSLVKRSQKPLIENTTTLQKAMTLVKDFMTDHQKSYILLREGKNAADKDNHYGAIDCLSAAINYNPTFIPLYLHRANSYKSLNMLTEAYFDYSYAIRLEPENGSHYCLRALVLARMKRFTMALEDADYSITLEPSAYNYYSRGTILADRNFIEAAVQDFTRALEETSISNELKLKNRYRRALAHFDLRNYEKCTEDIAATLVLDANHIPSRALLGRALKMTFEYNLAEEQLTHVIEVRN